MSDPLSVAASITGLIALAGQLYVTLDGFITNVRDAPSLAQTISSEIKSFRNSLNALHGVLHDPAFCRSRRAALISADYVVVSFTDAVLVFSQLEYTVIPLTKFTEFGIAARTQWTRKKQKLNELVCRLQWQKHTLVLQLNILRCASDIEAEQNRQALDDRICERLGRDNDMERRLALVEQQIQLQSNASLCDRASIISSRTMDSDHTIRPVDSAHSNITPTSQTVAQHAFEELLNSSWVYRRNQNREEDMSMRSSVLRLSAWSILSDMSLANISVIAVISLPVQLQELANGAWYSAKSDPLLGGLEQRMEASSSVSQVGGNVRDEDHCTKEEIKQGGRVRMPEAFAAEEDDEQYSDSNADDEKIYHREEEKAKIRENQESKKLEVKENVKGEENDVVIDYDDETFYCKKCEQVLEEGKAFELAGDRWHIDCFRCEACNSLIDDDANLLLLGDGTLICTNCTYSCFACSKKIEDVAILTGDKAFCATCFKCRNCKKLIEDLRYARTSQGIFCIRCHEALMARRRKKAKAKIEEAVTT